LAGLLLIEYASIDGVRFSFLTPHFQDGGHDVISRKKCCRLMCEREAFAVPAQSCVTTFQLVLV